MVSVYWSADIDKWLSQHSCDAIRQLSFVDKVSSYDEVVLLLRALFQWFSIDQSVRDGVDSYPVYQHLNQLVGSIINYQEEASSRSFLWDFWCSHLLSTVLSLREKVYLSKRNPHVSSDALHKSFQEYLIRILIKLKDHCDKHDLSNNRLHHQLVSVAIKGLIDLFYHLSSSHFSQANTWLSLAVQCEKLKRLQNNHLIKPTVDNSFINQIINTCGVQAFKCFMGDATRDYEINFSWIGVLGRFLCMKNSVNTRDTHRSAIKLLYHYFVVSVKSQQESSSLELGNGIDRPRHITKVAIWYVVSLMGKQPYGSQESYSLVLFMSDLLQSKGTVKTPLGKWLLHQMMSLLKESSLTESTIFILNVHRLNFLMMFDSMSTRSINMAKQLFLFLANRSDKVIDSQGKLFHSSLGLFDRAVKHLESEESSSKRLSQWELFTYVKWSRDFCQQKIDRLPALSLPS